MALVTETFAFDGGRQVTAYVPARPAEAVIYCGDGELVTAWGADIETDGLLATALVGVHRSADETVRLHEYSPGFDPALFARHEAFLVRDVRDWANASLGLALPRERSAILGVSAGGELALALGARHPDMFGAVLAASPGAGFRPSAATVRAMPPTYLIAGRQEPFFLENAQRWAEALQAHGTEMTMVVRDGGHDDTMWRAELPKMVEWAFSRHG